MEKQTIARNVDFDLKSHLKNYIRQLQEIMENLSPEGRKLNEYELELIRPALIPILKDMQSEIEISFLTGNKRMIEQTIEQVKQLTLKY